MGSMVDMSEAIFQSAGQAVHVAFVVMAHEPTQDGPLRKALIRVMESIRLDDKQRTWLGQLRGERSDTINFAGLSAAEIRAQCAMITEAVKSLPQPEMWALQARYGFVEFDDVGADSGGVQQLVVQMEAAEKKVRSATERLKQARKELELAREVHLKCEQRIVSAQEQESKRQRYHAARDDVRDISGELRHAESALNAAAIAVKRLSAPQLINNGPAVGTTKRRFVFSRERIAAIQGLSDWLQPQVPRIKPLALDFLLGRLYAEHSRVEIDFRTMAENFGGSHMQYFRAHCKLKNRLRELEQKALLRLEPRLVEHGVARPTETA